MKNPVSSQRRVPAVPGSGGRLRIAIDTDPRALVPYATTSAGSTDVQGFVYMQLAEVGPDLATYAPRLAERWRWSADHLALEVRLRAGLRWDDGAPLDAEDVRFSFEVARDPRVGWNGAGWKSRIERCEIVDRLTVRYRFTQTYPDQFMDANAGFVVPRHRLEHLGFEKWVDPALGAVGCGPFRLESWDPGRSLTLVRNPHYHEPGRPRLDRIDIAILPDPEERLRALRDGRVDLLEQVPEREAAALRHSAQSGAGDVRIVSFRGRQYDFVCYSPRHPALASRTVRRALTLAADRASIIERACSGFAEAFESPILPIVWAYDAGAPLTPYDPAGARALLDRDGWVDRDGGGVRERDGGGVRERDGVPLAFELATNVESARRVAAAHLLAESWRAIGARAEVRTMEHASLLDRLDGRRFEAALSGWRARLKPDLEPMWGCSSVGSKTNRVDYCNPEVDRLNAAALRTVDLDQARALFQAAARLVAQDHPYTWLYYLHDVVGVRRRLRGAVFDARGIYINPQDWWVEPDPAGSNEEPS